MSFNPKGGVEIPLEVFGSWVTEMAPIDLPKGVSPDNQELTFSPGNASSRAAFQKLFAQAFPFGGSKGYVPTLVEGKSFLTPEGVIKNLYFDSNGALWVEDRTNNPGVISLLLQSTPGSFYRGITAFGREYIAISDGLHGQEMPLQYDGTYLDRVTQCGPAKAPSVQSVSLPASTLTTQPGAAPTIASATTVQKLPNGNYAALEVTFTAPAAIEIGQSCVIGGNTNGVINAIPYYTVGAIVSGSPGAVTAFLSFDWWFPLAQTGTGGTATFSATATLSRANNTVSAVTSTAHGLQVGYQAQISGMDTLAVGGGIVSIVIANDTLPGLATVTTTDPHGLLPQNQVNISGVSAEAVGSGISTAVREGDSVTLTMNAVHGLIPGVQIQVAGVSDASFAGSFIVQIVPSPTQIVYLQVDTDSSSSMGTVSLAWPIPSNTPDPTYFEVQTAPTPTTFQIQVSYCDGTWSSGNVYFPWNGTFFVTVVQSATAFQYRQYGPPGISTTTGTVTPWGQCAPGLHVCQVFYLTRQGAVTPGSPPMSFIANGGQYVNVANIATGPANIVARILAFSGAQPDIPGAQPPMYYLPVPANITGLIVSTATQIDDNTTTSALLDFSDNSLFAGIGVSEPGNNLRTAMVLDGALGLGYYDTRLSAWGQRNTVQNLLNMGFEADGAGASAPSGWALSPGSGSGTISLAWRPTGTQWQMQIAEGGAPCSVLSQGAYQDAYGVPILSPLLTYKIRGWFDFYSQYITFYATLSSASTSFSATASIAASAATEGSALGGGGWAEAVFSAALPATVPADLLLTVYGEISALLDSVLVIDELSLAPTETPYIDTAAFASYGDNPEGMDGLSGKFGPANDSHKIMDMAFLRDTLYILTQDPGGRIHETTGSGQVEPFGWEVNEVDANCGTLSAFALTKSQADDSSASGGEEWLAWASESGARIFGGGTAYKISQEIQSAWSGLQSVTAWPQINMQAALTIKTLNDPIERVIYFFLPIGSTATAPTQIYPVSYRELDTAEQIASAPPYHPSLMGRLIATDNTRKWTHWWRTMNGAARMYLSPGQLTTVFFGGNGQSYGAAQGYGNVYTLNASLQVDDDYGQFTPYYTTCFLPDALDEQNPMLGSHRKMLCYLQAFIAWTGQLAIAPLLGSLSNRSNVACLRTASNPTPTYDVEWPGGSVSAQRMAFQIAVTPQAGSQANGFSLQKFIPTFREAKRLPVRGSV